MEIAIECTRSTTPTLRVINFACSKDNDGGKLSPLESLDELYFVSFANIHFIQSAFFTKVFALLLYICRLCATWGKFLKKFPSQMSLDGREDPLLYVHWDRGWASMWFVLYLVLLINSTGTGPWYYLTQRFSAITNRSLGFLAFPVVRLIYHLTWSYLLDQCFNYSYPIRSIDV